MAKQSVSRIGVIEEDSSVLMNIETRQHYEQRIELLLTSLFQWHNLPNNIPERFIEKILYQDGRIAFVNDKNFGYIMTQCTLSNSLNIYNEPTKWECFSANGYRNSYWTDEIGIVRNNKFSYPTQQLIKHHVKRLVDIERTIDANLYQQRNLAVILTKEEKLLTNKNYMKKFDNNGYFVIANKDSFEEDNFKTINFEIPFMADKLEDIKERKFNDLLNMFGINTVNTQKKERLVTDEANSNNQMIQVNIHTMLRERELAVEQINEKFDLDIEVEFSEDLKESLMKGSEEIE